MDCISLEREARKGFSALSAKMDAPDGLPDIDIMSNEDKSNLYYTTSSTKNGKFLYRIFVFERGLGNNRAIT